MNLLESDDLGPQKIEEKFLPFREEKRGEGGDIQACAGNAVNCLEMHRQTDT